MYVIWSGLSIFNSHTMAKGISYLEFICRYFFISKLASAQKDEPRRKVEEKKTCG